MIFSENRYALFPDHVLAAVAQHQFEAEIDAENRAQQAAEFKQSLIDERDALMERRRSIGSRLATMEYTDPEFFLLNVQEDVMGRYTNVLRQRLRLLDKPVKQTV